MRLKWRDRLEQQPRLWDFDRWPSIPQETLPDEHRHGFMRNKQIVAQVLAGHTLRATAREHAVSPGRVTRLLERCLGGDDTEVPALTRGLIPHRQVATTQRRTDLPSHARPYGYTGAFQELLEQAPSVREGLDAMIEESFRDTPYAQRLSLQGFHGEFKRLLGEISWPRNRYPFTAESEAYSSLSRHLRQRIIDYQRARQQRRQRSARRSGSALGQRPLNMIEIDEHILDISNYVKLMLNDELIPLRLARANVLVAVDQGTTCVIGYYLAPTRHPDQQDLLALIEHCLGPWQAPELVTPGLSYAHGACFPSGLDDAAPITFGTVKFDNALMHRAQSVIDLLCGEFGATLHLGPPATPTVRRQVESVFDYIARTCTHRSAATTGSYPTDPIRESRKNRKRPPAISFHTLNEALSVILTEHNVTPREAFGGYSPLALFDHQSTNHFVRYVPDLITSQWRPLVDTVQVPLHWYTHEKRQPHINFYYVRYKGSGLIDVAGKVDYIRVRFNRHDIRALRAFTLDGDDLGELKASTPWQRFPHSITTRKRIHRDARSKRIGARDPLADYFRLLLEHKGEPSTALEIQRVYTEFTAGGSTRLVLDKTGTDTPYRQKRQSAWEPARANHRKPL